MKTPLVVAACVAFLVGCSPAGSGSGQTSSPVPSATPSVATSTSSTPSTSPRPSAFTVEGEGGPSSPSPKPGVVEGETSLYDAIDAIPGFEAVSENHDKRCVTGRATLPLVHTDPAAGTFTQRFVFCMSGDYKLNDIHFTGDGDGLATDTTDGGANTLKVGRRFWDRLPDGASWEQLTHKAVAQDVEFIRSSLVNGLRLTGPWTGYGVSMGATDALWHKMYYPQAMAAVWADSPAIAPDPATLQDRMTQWASDPSAGGSPCFVQTKNIQRQLLQHPDRHRPLVLERLSPYARAQWNEPDMAYEGWVLMLPTLLSFTKNPADCSQLPNPTDPPAELIAALADLPDSMGGWIPGDLYQMAADGSFPLHMVTAPDVSAMTRTAVQSSAPLPPQAKRPAVDGLGEGRDLRSWLDKRADHVIITFTSVSPLAVSAPVARPERQLLVTTIPAAQRDTPSAVERELYKEWTRWLDNLD